MSKHIPAPDEQAPNGEIPDEAPDSGDPHSVNHLLRRLAECTQEHAIMLLDREGRITWWNSGAERIFGLTQSEAIGRTVSRLFTGEDVRHGLPEHEMTVAREDSTAEDDRWMKRGDGTRFWATGLMVALRDKDGRLLGYGKILRSRTDLWEQLETLRNQVEDLDASSRAKDVFLSTLSHELRNPLAPLSNAVDLIRRTAPATPDLAYPLQVIERQVDSLRRLVDDLLDLSRIGAGKIELKKEPVALEEIVQRAVESNGPSLRGRRHDLVMLLPPTPMTIEADRDRLVQVFVNLLNNACKFTPEGGTIWIKGTIEDQEAVIQIKDTGVGIPTELMPRLFELFTQAESSRTWSEGGLGIGLSLVKNLVTLHGGSVQANSDGPGKGSEFTVRLPLKR
ncbi:MAG TPA: ATP-binding protein [Candidatus Polarisedimenticolia bacterium]|nr:ATP-binding protein [Candidatus Polarisedimenticolia bacterium]